MSYIPTLRFLSLFTLAGALATVILGGGVSAQSVVLPTRPMQSQSISNVTAPNMPMTQTGSNTSALNWAGYVATAGTYTSVSGSWVVPTVQNASAENVADATWVGIGGVTSKDLIQAGTEALPDSHGDLVYQAWYELLPQNSQAVPLAISPGDAVSVAITEESTNVWEISFDDATTGKAYEVSVQYSSSLSSADWVEEMPVEVGGVLGLDDFGTVNFTTGYAIKNGDVATVQASGATPLTMDNSAGQIVATTSGLGANGSSFTVARTNAASSPLALSRNGTSVAAPSYAVAATGGTSYTGSYTTHVRHGRGGYRVVIQFQ